MHKKEKGTLIYPSGVFDPSDWLLFIHLHLFDDEWSELKLDDDDLRALQVAIMAGPNRHPVVPHTGGMRKIRFSDEASHRGKSGAYRIGYAFFPAYATVLLITVWGKSDKSDLTMADRKAIASMIREIQEILDSGDKK
jgi:hypothetical protein